MSFIVLVAAGLLVPLFYKSNIFVAKLIATLAFILSAYFIYTGKSLEGVFPMFVSDPATNNI